MFNFPTLRRVRRYLGELFGSLRLEVSGSMAALAVLGLLAPAGLELATAPVASASPLVLIPVGANAQALVDAYPPGSVFVVASGVHLGFRVAPKAGDSFVGQPGAVLDGGGLVANAFYVTSALPANVTVSGSSASDLMVVRNYLDNAQEQVGSIQPIVSTKSRADHWTLQWLEVTGSYSRGITTSDDMTITGCLVDHNGRLGIGGTGRNVVVSGNEISYNDTRDVASGYERGGAKLSGTSGLVFEGNFVHDNIGPGVWTDMDAIFGTISNNRIVNNYDAGVLNEISHYTVVSGNWISGNGVASHPWLFGAGIVASTSDNLQAYGNVVDGNGNGITGVQQNRGSGPYGVRLLQNLAVQDNAVVNSGTTGVGEDTGDLSVFSRNLRYVSDSYQGGRFSWMGHGNLSWPVWRGFGQDPGGSWTL
jgi:hypothetical protein